MSLRKDKEEDRMIHVRITNANVEPVFLPILHTKKSMLLFRILLKTKSRNTILWRRRFWSYLMGNR